MCVTGSTCSLSCQSLNGVPWVSCEEQCFGVLKNRALFRHQSGLIPHGALFLCTLTGWVCAVFSLPSPTCL